MKRYDLPTPQTISEGLQSFGYIPDANTANVLYYAMVLEKPLLIEGPAGAGKTELAKRSEIPGQGSDPAAMLRGH
jgi:MoxR-like ATPase